MGKRFYENATVEQLGENLFGVLLDGRPVKTPKGTHVELPTRHVAQAVADEWMAQGEKLNPKQMCLTTLGCTAVDLIRFEREETVDRMMEFLAMDTVCFGADAKILQEMQAKEWAPLREWFEGHFGVKLGIAEGIGSPSHHEDTLEAVAKELKTRDEWELTALEVCTSTVKSLIVSCALNDRIDLTPKTALRLGSLEEFYQIEYWGLVEGEHDDRQDEATKWLAACRLFGRVGRQAPE